MATWMCCNGTGSCIIGIGTCDGAGRRKGGREEEGRRKRKKKQNCHTGVRKNGDNDGDNNDHEMAIMTVTTKMVRPIRRQHI